MLLRLAAAAAILALGACSGGGWFGDEPEEALPGERVSVLLLNRALEADPALAEAAVTLPPPVANAAWPVPWGTPLHAMHHLAASETLAVQWRTDAGAGETDESIILSAPVIAGGHVFLLDSASNAAAISLENRRRVWSRSLLPPDEDEDASVGGGVAYAGGVLHVATAFGELFALDAASGEILWRQAVGSSLRAAPAVAGGRVFAISSDNRLFSLDAGSGEVLWTHEGIVEPAGLMGAAVPAVSTELVIAAYSSGEIFALRVENGRVAWTDSLILQGRFGAETSLSDIDASPVVDGGVVFAVSRGGNLAAIDLRSGLRFWEQQVSSAQTPWIAGDHLYIVSGAGELMCLQRSDGRIRWVTLLPRYEDPEDREDPIVWSGPVLAGEHLILAGSHGEVRRVAARDGAVVHTETLAGGMLVPPVIADGAVYFLTRDAELIALR